MRNEYTKYTSTADLDLLHLFKSIYIVLLQYVKKDVNSHYLVVNSAYLWETGNCFEICSIGKDFVQWVIVHRSTILLFVWKILTYC